MSSSPSPERRYRTIVCDPPWDHSDGTGTALINGRWKPAGGVPYSVLSVEEIAALPVRDLVHADGCHLYLWTTNRYVHAAYHVAEAWGFRIVKPLVWCKAPVGFNGRPFLSTCEFVLHGRVGKAHYLGDAGRQWWTWQRGAHSAKPEAFLDIVETVSPGPRLEMFARRQRLGWDTYGNEALPHVTLQHEQLALALA